MYFRRFSFVRLMPAKKKQIENLAELKNVQRYDARIHLGFPVEIVYVKLKVVDQKQ